MNTKRLFRFRICGLLALTFLVASSLGTWIWFRQSRLDAARRLADQGIGVLSTSDAPPYLSREIRSGVPFVRPALAEVYVHVARDGSVHLNGQPLSLAESKAAILKKRDAIRASGINNVHLLFAGFDCTVSDLMGSKDGSDTAKNLMKFANENGFASTGFLEANQIGERKRSLDPNGIVHSK